MGFPSPAKDHQEDRIDLSALLVKHPSATFYFRNKGDSMTGTHIPDDALLIVDRSIKMVSGMVIVGVLNGEFIVRRIIKAPRSWVLHAENPAYKPIALTEEMDFVLWGIVTVVVIPQIKGLLP